MRKTIAVLVSVLTLTYMLPWAVAYARQKENMAAIFALNLFLGWTLVGWVIALVWALMKE